MGKHAKVYSSEEILNVLDKAWLNTKDIKIISGTGITKAREIKRKIAEIITNEGYFLPDGLVPTDRTIQYLNLNVEYLKSVVNKQS